MTLFRSKELPGSCFACSRMWCNDQSLNVSCLCLLLAKPVLVRMRIWVQTDMESLWMPPDDQMEMEANVLMITRKISKAQDLLRKMRSRWDLFRKKHKLLVPLVHARWRSKCYCSQYLPLGIPLLSPVRFHLWWHVVISSCSGLLDRSHNGSLHRRGHCWSRLAFLIEDMVESKPVHFRWVQN